MKAHEDILINLSIPQLIVFLLCVCTVCVCVCVCVCVYCVLCVCLFAYVNLAMYGIHVFIVDFKSYPIIVLLWHK